MDREAMLIAYLLESGDNYSVDKIREEYFDDPGCRELFLCLRNKLIGGGSVTVKDLNFETEGKHRDILRRVRKYRRSMPSEASVMKFIASKMVRAVVLEEIPKLSVLEADYEKLKRTIEEAQLICINGDRKHLGTTFESYDFEAGKETAETKEIPTFLRDISLFPGELGAWAGLPKRGKTRTLINTGVLGIIHGNVIYHWSLEVPKFEVFRRYASRLLGEKVETERQFERAKKRMKCFGGSLEVKDEPRATVSQIRDWVLRGRPKPGLLIVDYADLVVPPRRRPEARFELKDIFLELRNISKEFAIPVWTVSQLGVKSKGKMVAGMEDLEEAKIVKAGICSLVISLNQTEDEEEAGIVRAFVVASTRQVKKKRRLIEVNYDAEYMKEIISEEKPKDK